MRTVLATVAEALLCGPSQDGDTDSSVPAHALDMLLEATQSLAQFEHIQEQVSAGGAVTGEQLYITFCTRVYMFHQNLCDFLRFGGSLGWYLVPGAGSIQQLDPLHRAITAVDAASQNIMPAAPASLILALTGCKASVESLVATAALPVATSAGS